MLSVQVGEVPSCSGASADTGTAARTALVTARALFCTEGTRISALSALRARRRASCVTMSMIRWVLEGGYLRFRIEQMMRCFCLA